MSSPPQETGPRRRGAPVKYLVLVVLAAAAVVVWFVLRAPTPPPVPQQVLPVETVHPAIGDLDRSITLDSHVSSNSVVTILPKVSGNLIALNADVGTRLTAGEVIAKIDPEPYQIALDQAKAIYDGARTIYDRQKQLYATGSTSQANYDQARTQYENARSQFEMAKLRLSYTTIVSPADGTVIQRHVSNGALVSQSVPIATISNTRSLIVRVAVPEEYARIFEEKQATMPITATIPAMGSQPYTLRIRAIAPAVDARTKTFAVECEIEGDTSGVMPGMFAQATFVVDRRQDIAYLPFDALVGGDTLWYVAADGTAQYLTVTPGYHNDSYFEVPRRYSGYAFILVGQHFLSAGSPVRATPAVRTAQ